MPARFSIPILIVVMAGLWFHSRNMTAVAADLGNRARTPILVELFTSEGCSSCPPADRLLEKFDTQPIDSAQLIVLSEHVDYWNHIGWTDPYSSAFFSQRQSRYGDRFRLDGVYTPQMVVDGSSEFVGNSDRDARAVFAKSQPGSKIPVQIHEVRLRDGMIHAQLETGPVSQNARRVDVVFVVALNHAESQVARGENAGHQLTHVAVVRNLQRIATLEAGQSFNQEVSLPVAPGLMRDNLRVIAFLQESGQGRVLGAAEAILGRDAR